MSETEQPRDEGSLRGVKRFLWLLLVCALILAVWGIVSRVRGRDRIGEETARDAIPVVRVAEPAASPATDELVLPGNVQAFIEAPIYARTSGYLKSWYTDIGTPVKKGQLLAEIETPEVDQQLRQAKADLETAEANARIAAVTDVRWKGLLVHNAVSPQDADTRSAAAQATRATADSARANVGRLEQLESFKRVVAPFDGVVTLRNTDIGALINAGQSAGEQLFRVADTSRLRVYVQVPEPYAPRTTPGVAAELRFNEHPGKEYPAKVVRTARALDPALRTLQVELQVDNASGELFPGAYAEVHFKLPGNTGTLRVPATSLMFRSAGLQVATVGADDRVKLRSIVQGRDFGTFVEVLAGLGANDEVIVDPPDSIADGVPVRIARPRQGTKQQGSPQQGPKQYGSPQRRPP
ncbi:MAG TPA: efflux RND transporter periplasmic adaptor subunit [Steroidobacteraceae bacterium]|nr:efflux RND transporter periplasmic adaptor subunit [Steroidobacteraceae bacterium]